MECSGPRCELQRTLDGEYGVKYRNSPSIQAALATRVHIRLFSREEACDRKFCGWPAGSRGRV